MILPNRLGVYGAIATGIIGAVIPVVVDMDTTTTAGWIAGMGAIVTAITTWLVGWMRHEARQAMTAGPDDPAFPVAPDEPQTADVAPVV